MVSQNQSLCVNVDVCAVCLHCSSCLRRPGSLFFINNKDEVMKKKILKIIIIRNFVKIMSWYLKNNSTHFNDLQDLFFVSPITDWFSPCCKWRQSPGRCILWSDPSAPYSLTCTPSAHRYGSDRIKNRCSGTCSDILWFQRPWTHSHVTRGWRLFPGSRRSGLCPRQTPSPPTPSGCLSHYWGKETETVWGGDK